MFRNDEINVCEKRIQANIPVHFELHLQFIYCVSQYMENLFQKHLQNRLM